MVMPMMPPKARAATLRVPAVPRRKDGTERDRAATRNMVSQSLNFEVVDQIRDLLGMTVVTAVPMPNMAEKAYRKLIRSGLRRAMRPVKRLHQPKAKTSNSR